VSGQARGTVDIWEAMSTARSIRRFTDEAVDDSLLLRCLEAATWAPSGGNQQPWRFVILKSAESRRAVALGAAEALKVIREVYRMDRPSDDDDSPRARDARAVMDLHEAAADVPAAVLFCMLPQPASPPLMQGAFIYPAMQNFLLAARASGLGAVVTGWNVRAESQLRQAVQIPDEWELAAMVVVGWPKGHHGPLRRKPVTDVTVIDRWDRPARF